MLPLRTKGICGLGRRSCLAGPWEVGDREHCPNLWVNVWERFLEKRIAGQRPCDLFGSLLSETSRHSGVCGEFSFLRELNIQLGFYTLCLVKWSLSASPHKECCVKCSIICAPPQPQRKAGSLDHVTLILNRSPRRHPVLFTSDG